MRSKNQSRRDFIKSSGRLFSGTWLTINLPLVAAAAQTACSRRDSRDEGWVNLTAAEAEGLGAVADQIIPPDDSPGAVEAGVVHFIDAAVTGFMAGSLPVLREGLASLDRQAGGRFAALSFEQQTEILRANEESAFFQAMQMLTSTGMLAMPAYGGNRDYAGWQLIGFDHRHAWQPPFGHYDAQADEAGEGHVEA
jgi:hypothetical protein